MTRTTRRQLEADLAATHARAHSLSEKYGKARHQLVVAENQLEALGYVRKDAPRESPFAATLRGDDIFDYALTKDAIALKEINDRTRAVAARRDTLEAVIQALELKEYGYVAPGEYSFSLHEGHHQADRLWSDIEVTLGERAARKLETERAAAETRIKRLTEDAYAPGDRIAFYFADTDAFDPAAPTVSDLNNATKVTGVGEPTTSYGAAETLDKPAPKKPAKKKAAAK